MRLTQKSFQNLLRQLIGAAVIIFLLVMVLMLVPAHSLEKSLQMWMSFLPPSDILHWKSAVDKEISLVMKLQGSILISRLLALTLRHTTRIYIRYFQSILIVVLSSRLVPVVMTQLYVFDYTMLFLSLYLSTCLLHSLAPHGTSLTIIPLPLSIIINRHNTHTSYYYLTGTSSRPHG
jgi:hypothetical protein